MLELTLKNTKQGSQLRNDCGGLHMATIQRPSLGSFIMKEIKLNRCFVVLVDDEDYEYLNQFNWSVTEMGNMHYAQNQRKIKGKWQPVLMHMVIKPNLGFYIIDHLDQNGLNNQKNNLRFCTKSKNAFNSVNYCRGVSEYRGVTYVKRHKKYYWRARIMVNKKEILGGYFNTEEEAALRYNELAKKYVGEHMYLNEV